MLPEVPDEQKDLLLLDLLREKYRVAEYRELLLATGDLPIHEDRGRPIGPPSRYVYYELKPHEIDANRQLIAEGKEPFFIRGGDILGKLLMQVRDEIRMSA